MARRGRTLFGDEQSVLFLTTTVMNFDPIFQLGKNYYNILLNSMKFVLAKYHGVLYAYVLMPSHIHAVIELARGHEVSDLMRDFKKYTSTKIRQTLEAEGRRFWVERLRENSPWRKGQVFKLWMDRFDDVALTSSRTMLVKVNYIHMNPVKAGLVSQPEEWDFSSARNYLGITPVHLEVMTEW